MMDLGSPDQKSRIDAATLLGKSGRSARTAIPSLTAIVCEGQPVVSWAAANAIRRIGLADTHCILNLIRAHADGRLAVRKPAAHSLAAITSDAQHAVMPICELLEDGRPAIREAACYALGRIGPGSTDALPKLEKLIEDRDFHVRSQARIAVSCIRNTHEQDMAPCRAEYEAHSKAKTDHDLFESGEVAIDETAAAKSVADMLKSDCIEERYEAVQSLGSFDSEIRLDLLELALEDSAPRVREAAAYALGELGDAAKPLAPLLLKILQDRDKNVRKAAFFAIHKIVH